ncbi:hypothetical protein [Roseibium sediminicola]|uniref:Uncharacterized protein n=1 Tax=Roseibium sediminicola TaxID=2933272 RepID=A0ABT0GQ77_9HYPH|nr:hypothetical protein [Roseibium sp. CAU 1639]MCK7611586.1 hypothetical protein [Roseibium sp. CAU 1639]
MHRANFGRRVLKTAVVAGLAGLAAAGAGHADPTQLNAAEIKDMMSGNSIFGFFPDGVTEYRQNNHSDGVAVVVVKGDKIRNIPWEAVEEDGTGKYCEDWSADGWGKLCFTVTREEATRPVFTNAKGKANTQSWAEGFVDLNFAD